MLRLFFTVATAVEISKIFRPLKIVSLTISILVNKKKIFLNIINKSVCLLYTCKKEFLMIEGGGGVVLHFNYTKDVIIRVKKGEYVNKDK